MEYSENEDASLDKIVVGHSRWTATILHMRNESRNDDDCDHMDAVQEAQLQASFCEQTAREMEQVLNWWCLAAKTDRRNRRVHLSRRIRS